MAGKRTIITLPEEDKEWLESYSHANQISMAEAIRKGIHKLKENEVQETYRTLVQNTQGIWKQGDGLEYQRSMRSE
jgi:hypothetical protein